MLSEVDAQLNQFSIFLLLLDENGCHYASWDMLTSASLHARKPQTQEDLTFLVQKHWKCRKR